MDINTPARQTTLEQFGVVYFRPATAPTIDGWTGKCAPCETALKMGLKLVLTIRANGGGYLPTSPPSDLEAYKSGLSEILEQYKPEVLVIENEENSILFYTGTPQEYGVELQAACEVAHARNIPCTNGGLVSTEVALLVWNNYHENGKTAEACSFAQRSFDADTAKTLCSAGSSTDLPERIKSSLEKGISLLEVYQSSGMDYMNFHWYIPDAAALAETVAFLEKEIGLPLMSNEMGQQFNEQPETVTLLLQTSQTLNLRYVIWFNADGPKARALSNPDGSLRPNGEAFRDFMHMHFK